MYKVQGMLLWIFVCLLGCHVTSAVAQSSAPQQGVTLKFRDDPHLVSTIKRVMQNDVAGALQEASKSHNPEYGRAVVEVLRIYNNPNSIPLKSVEKFLHQHNWMPQEIFLPKIERSISDDTPYEDVLYWFSHYEPISNRGKFYLVHANVKLGRLDPADHEAKKWLSEIWQFNEFDLGTENTIIREYKNILTVENLVNKIEFLIWNNSLGFANTLIELLPAPKRKLYHLYIKIAKDNNLASNHYRGAKQTDEFIKYVYIKTLVKKGEDEAALRLLAETKPTKHFDKWWKVKNSAMREALKQKQYRLAFALTQHHQLKEGTAEFADAQWYGGWIALCFLNDPITAIQSFKMMHSATKLANSRSKAAYWLAKAYDASKDLRNSDHWYQEASMYTATFYGQIAMTQCKMHDARYYFDGYKRHSDIITTHVDSEKITKIAMLAYHLFKAGQKALAYHVINYISSLNLDRMNLEAAARFFNTRQLFPLAVELGKASANRSFIVVKGSYPHELPVRKGALDIWCYLAVIRQESNFDQQAQSPAGAKGLMQLMPETAKHLAAKLGLPHNAYASDAQANILKGSAYLDQLYQKYNSMILAVAAYNAGPGNVAKWIDSLGDPRELGDVESKLNWIESVPFAETRNYIKKVIENMVIYNAMLSKNANTDAILQFIF